MSHRMNEALCSDGLAAAAASRASARKGMEPLSSDGLAGVSGLSGRKGKRARVAEEIEEGVQEDDRPPAASRGGHGMAKRASVLEEEEEMVKSKIRPDKSITCKEIEHPSSIEVEKKFTYDDDVELEDVNCLEKSFGGVRIPNNALEAEIGIGKHEVDFILVLEKSSMFHHLCHMNFHTENKCIMITGDGEPDVATRAFLKMLVDVTQLKTYALVDPDAHGVQTLCTYAFGSTKMPDDWLGLEVPSIHWLEILPGDLTSLTESDRSNISDFSEKEQRISKGLLKHRLKVLPKLWIKRIKKLASQNTSVSLESLYSLGFGYLSKVFIPKLLGKETEEPHQTPGVSKVTLPEKRPVEADT